MQAPSVPVPLDAGAFIDDPCQSLTQAQYTDLGLEPGEIELDSPAAACTWWDKAEASASVYYQSDPREGLDELYEQQDNSDFYPAWEPTEVNGYPAVVLGDSGLTGDVACGIALGLSDSLYFTAKFEVYDVDQDYEEKYEENCLVARDIAVMVVENIKSSG